MNGPVDIEDRELPRVLIVSHTPLERVTATGITLSNIFGDWPVGSLAQLFVADAPPPQGSTARRLPASTAPLDLIFRRMLSRNGSSVVQARAGSTSVPFHREDLPVAQRLHSHMRAVADVSPVRLDDATRRWLAQIDPDVVYSPLGNARITRLAVHVARHLRKPLVPHFLDDWPSTLYTSGEAFGVARRLVARDLQRALGRAPEAIAISPQMAREYEDRYGVPFVDVMNCVEMGPDQDRTADETETLRIVYAGGMHLGRGAMLGLLAEALPSVQLPGRSIRLSIIGDSLPDFRPTASASRFVDLLGPRPSDEIEQHLRSADILLHVESMDAGHRAFTRLSISTKIPQYLAAGRPVIAFGPPDLASMQHLASSGAALAITTTDVSHITGAINALADDPGERCRRGRVAREFALTHHSSSVVRRSLEATLKHAAASPPRRGPNRPPEAL